MNVTSEIKTLFNNEIVEIIESRSEIQFYYNPTIDVYQWKDSRFPETNSVWENGKYTATDLLVEAFSRHIECVLFEALN